MDRDADGAAVPEWQEFVQRCRERSLQCEKAARVHLFMIVLTLVAGLIVFVGGEQLGKWAFSTRAERDADVALANAGARLKRELAALADPASEFIRTLPEQLRPALEKMLRDIAGLPPPPEPDVPPAPRPAPVRPPEPVPAPPAPAVQPFTPVPSTAAPPPPRAAAQRRQLSQSEMQARLEQYERLVSLYERNAALHAELMAERDRQAEAADGYLIETLRNDTAREIAQIGADSARERAQAELDIARANADAQSNAATESTTRSEDLNALVSGSVTRVGAVVLVIWLVRIFLRDRQRYAQRSDFFRGLADAMSISRGNLADFRELVAQLVPPTLPDGGEAALPMEAVGQLLAGAAKRAP
ncbi:hypothetical protein [Aromatoleum sp.]|uniref:hypothetical protein n=1 Tax=Aromatoleum sp. TaxID=2307007 RepID=UPI002FCB99C6